jgi:3',5'-cyclic AMP phosphodiesterase CpdA
VLDPAALLEKLNDIDRQRSAHPEHADLPQERYEAIRAALTDPELSASTPGASAVRAPRDYSRPPATVYLQPHAALSQFQSVISYCFDAQLVSAGRLDASEHGLRHWLAEIEERLRRYGPCDIRWIEPTLLNLLTKLTSDKHPFPDKRPPTVPLAARAKVFIVGDWATGLPQARNVAHSIRTQLDAVAGEVECHVIHLGDTYYSGEEEEYEHRYLPLWPVDEGSRATSWSLNGNHDMYAGGHGYFEVLLGDPRFAQQAGCSYFCLGNEHWQIVGLDDSYTDPDKPDLAGSQVDWLRDRLAPTDRPGTILLSHHQPFSAWEVVSSALAGRVAEAVGERRIEAWLWGHEHRCAVYEPGIRWRAYQDHAEYTAIVGHGGVPNLVSGPAVTPPAEAVDQRYLRWQNTDNYTVAQDTWSYGGFAVIDIEGASATVQYFTEVGEPRTDEHGAGVEPDPLSRVS